MYCSQFEQLIIHVENFKIRYLFSYDNGQGLSKKERPADITEKNSKLSGFQEYKLSYKICTNKEMAYFIRRMLDITHTDILPNYPSISVSYANNVEEAKFLI